LLPQSQNRVKPVTPLKLAGWQAEAPQFFQMPHNRTHDSQPR
jgi:hypothetical protein